MKEIEIDLDMLKKHRIRACIYKSFKRTQVNKKSVYTRTNETKQDH